MNGYGIGDTIKNGFNLIYTKIIWKKARLIRRPILARNRKNIRYGEGFTCGINCRLNPSATGKLIIGRNFIMGDQCQIEAMEEVVIGDNVLLASKVYIGDACHGKYSGMNQSSPAQAPNDRQVVTKPIRIGNNVWIGNGATILGGIGSGCVIGAGAVVTNDVPDNSIVVGCPARVLKKYDVQEKIWKKTCGEIF